LAAFYFRRTTRVQRDALTSALAVNWSCTAPVAKRNNFLVHLINIVISVYVKLSPRSCLSTRLTMTIFCNLLPPAREPSLLLTFAVLGFDSGDNASDCAGKVHARIAFD
jgi:hypothetical protein